MKSRIIKRLICLLAAVVLAVGCALPTYAFDTDHGYVMLDFKNAPEGTEYIDILVPIIWDSDYLTEPHGYTVQKNEHFYEQVEGTGVETMYGGYKPIEWNYIKSTHLNIFIDENSEIAQYSKDGYVSLFGHTSMVKEDISISDRYENGELDDRHFRIYLCGSEQLKGSTEKEKVVDIFHLRNKFKDMKAAYVDKDGNVLGVTNKFDVDTHDDDYIFRADGDKLTLGFDGYDYWYNFGFILNFLILPLAVFVGIIAFLVVLFKLCRSSDK